MGFSKSNNDEVFTMGNPMFQPQQDHGVIDVPAPSRTPKVDYYDDDDDDDSRYGKKSRRFNVFVGGLLALVLIAGLGGGVTYFFLFSNDEEGPNSSGGGGNSSDFPTSFPTFSPTAPTGTLPPTPRPTGLPTKSPTVSPTNNPTINPTVSPTVGPTKNPTTSPTPKPTANPTPKPTKLPTKSPTPKPTKLPTSAPTQRPTFTPVNYASEFTNRVRFKLQTFDRNGNTPNNLISIKLGDGWQHADWSGDVNSDDQIEIEITVDTSCPGPSGSAFSADCSNSNSDLRQAISDLTKLCWQIGHSDNNGGGSIERRLIVCANSGKQRMTLSGDVNSDDDFLYSVYTNPDTTGSSSAMASFINSCYLHVRSADNNGSSGRQYGLIGFNGRIGNKPCSIPSGAGGSCGLDQLGLRWVLLNAVGDVDGNDRIYLRFRCGSSDAFDVNAGW